MLLLFCFFRMDLLLLNVIFLLSTLFLALFFRDPERNARYASEEIISPADGKIINIKNVFEPEHLNSKAVQVCIFMSVFNVHVNRSPLSGRIEFIKYYPGKFFSAFKEKASISNEQTHLGISGRDGKVFLKLIAGLIARRVVVWKNNGQDVKAGEKLGMIRFGSRVEVFLPEDYSVLVKRGAKVKAGLTVLAKKIKTV
ncbi:MAG: phosphatidylserine decarboxylase family protein [Thermodesulfobacteriota bacterium]|nr:phosphatidylserine decarboxylase family protein [Thermodesulfobacteriota bacterium]